MFAKVRAIQRVVPRNIIRSFSASQTPIFEGEPEGPKMVAPCPGPKSQELLKQMDQYQDSRTAHFFADYSKSKGNYIVDADGNTLLDIFCNIGSIAIGYNNPRLIAAAKSDQWIQSLINRPALGINPPVQWPNMLEESLLSVKPPGLNQVFTVMCGSCANECTYKSIFMAHEHKRRNGAPFSEEEFSSCMKNLPPGSPNLAIMSFQGGFHGRSLGTLTTTRSKPIHKVDIPAFNWPVAPFPNIKYPLHEHAAENAAEEARCLEETEKLLKTWPVQVAGMIIEPIMGEGGDKAASNDYYRKLRNLALKHDVAFAVDEVQTGVGATGKMWAHEHWGLETPPDAVSFAKKMQATGFYHNLNLRASVGYRNFNTWMGDPVRALQAKEIISEIKEKNLLDNTAKVGAYLKKQLEGLAAKHPKMTNIRGVGTFLAFDVPSPDAQVKFLSAMRQTGVQCGGSGTQSIRMRPMLIFGQKHADQLLERIESVISKLN